jgi:hypothetical protein
MMYLDVASKSPISELVARLADTRSRALLRMYSNHENSLVRATAMRELARLSEVAA